MNDPIHYQKLINDHPLLKMRLEELQAKLTASEAKVEELSKQILSFSSQTTPPNWKKRKADTDLPKEAKKVKGAASESLPLQNKTNDFVAFYPEFAPFLQTMTIEVPREEEPPLQFTLPHKCFIKIFPNSYAKLLASESGFKDNRIVWDKKDDNGDRSYYHPQAVAHILHFAACQALKDVEMARYKKLAQREDISLVDEILQDVLQLSQTHEIKELEQECAEFIAKRISEDPSSLVYYCGFVCQSKHLEYAWKKALYHTPWTDNQKTTISEQLIEALKDHDDLLFSQLKLIAEALAFLLTKETVAQLPSDSLKALSESLPLFNLSKLAHPASLIAKHPDASPIFSFFASLYHLSKEELSKEMPKLEEFVKTQKSPAALLLKGLWQKEIQDENQSLDLLDDMLKHAPSKQCLAATFCLKATYFLLHKQPEKALEETEKAINLQLQMSHAFYLKANSLLSLGKVAEAIDCLETISLIEHDYIHIWSKICKKEEMEKALTLLKARGLKSLFTLAGMASLYFKLSQYKEAFDVLNEVLELDSNQVEALVTIAKIYIGTKKYSAALDVLNRAKELHPNDDNILGLLGFCYYNLKDMPKALEALNRALELNPKNELLLMTRTKFYFKQGENALALKDVNRALELKPNNADILLNRADIYNRQKNYTSALADLNQAIQLNPNSNFYIAKRGETYLQQGELSAAFTDFCQAISINPKSGYAFARRGELHRIRGESEAALEDLNQAIQLNPKNDFALARRGEMRRLQGNRESALIDLDQAIQINSDNDFALARRGEMQRLQGEREAALTTLDQAIQANPDNDFALARRGEMRRSQWDRESALLDLNQAILINPHNDFALSSRGKLYGDRGEIISALADFSQAIQINSNNSIAFASRGEIYLKQGQLDLAIADFNQAFQKDPTNDLALSKRGEAYQLQGQLDLAIADFSQALLINPANDFAFASRGELYRIQGQLDSALQDLDAAIRLNSENDFALARRGEIRRITNTKGAVTDFNRAIQLNPGNAFALASRGELYRLKGNLGKARQDLNKALRINPNHRFALISRSELNESQSLWRQVLDDLNQIARITPYDPSIRAKIANISAMLGI